MDSEHCYEAESRPLLILTLSPGPFQCFRRREWCLVDEVSTSLVYDIPRVEVFDPRLQLLLSHLRGLINHGCQEPRVEYSCGPQFQSSLVVLAVFRRELPKVRDRHA